MLFRSADYNLEVDCAIEEILKFNPLNIYVKVKQKEKINSVV